MPRMLAISSVASSGMRRWAARRSALLYEPRRRLPEIPNTLIIGSVYRDFGASVHRGGSACNRSGEDVRAERYSARLTRFDSCQQLLGTARRLPGTLDLALELPRHALISLAERNALGHDQPVGLLGGMNGRIEPYGLGPELERTDRRRRHGEGLEGEIDGAEQRELDELQIAVIACVDLAAAAERLGETRLRGGGAAAHQLENIQVALLRHDRGTGCELL